MSHTWKEDEDDFACLVALRFNEGLLPELQIGDLEAFKLNQTSIDKQRTDYPSFNSFGMKLANCDYLISGGKKGLNNYSIQNGKSFEKINGMDPQERNKLYLDMIGQSLIEEKSNTQEQIQKEIVETLSATVQTLHNFITSFLDDKNETQKWSHLFARIQQEERKSFLKKLLPLITFAMGAALAPIVTWLLNHFLGS